MIFDLLSSDVIKAGLLSKLQFSLGFKLIAAHIRASAPPKLDFETKKVDDSAKLDAKYAKRVWAEFQAFCQTHSFEVTDLREIATAYVNSSSKPVQAPSQAILELRAKLSGQSIDKLKAAADKQADIQRGKLGEKIESLLVDMKDSEIYTNEYYHTGVHGDDDTVFDMDAVITDEWVKDNYPKVLKSQMAFWTRYNNWNDAELIMIEADQQLLA